MDQNQTPVVAICLFTYKQEKYIGKAIESVICQETNFSYKLFIGDDCSPDNTFEICKKYQLNNADKVTLLQTDGNNIAKNYIQTFKAAVNSGAKYICLLEGDDYWSSNDKLQMQVDFFNNHPDCVYNFTNYEVLNQEGEFNPKRNLPKKKLFDLHYLLKENIMPLSNSIMFRAERLFPLPEHYFECFNGDWVLLFHLAHGGKIGYIPKPTVVYRSNIGIISKTAIVYKFQKGLKTNRAINKATNYEYDYHIGKHEWFYENITYALLEDRKLLKGLLKMQSKLFSSVRENPLKDFWKNNKLFVRHSLKLIFKRR